MDTKDQKPISDQPLEVKYDYEDLGDHSGGVVSNGVYQYRSVSSRRKRAKVHAKQLERDGHVLTPVVTNERKIAKTFWGQAWCRNLSAHHDAEHRLPIARSYLRNGGVIDLKISNGKVCALVSAGELYSVDIGFNKLPRRDWKNLIIQCAGSIASMVELLSGNLSESVMRIITDERNGLFPCPYEISMSCDCPDFASMCEHVAAVLYGVGVRLDQNPELFFVLRGVDPMQLVVKSKKHVGDQITATELSFDRSELENLFGIEISLD